MSATSNQNFIEAFAPLAMEQMIKYGVPASVTLAQMIEETGWGKSTICQRDNNFFGIKQGSWNAAKCAVNPADGLLYRKYATPADCFDDHSRVVLNYHKTDGVSPRDYAGFISRIAGNYARDGKQYTNNIISLIQQHGLDAYDEVASNIAAQRGIQMGTGKTVDLTNPAQQKYMLHPLEGHWCMPLENIGQYRISTLFGETDGLHLKGHKGLDIAAGGNHPPAFATEDNGKVIKADGSGQKNGGMGNYVIVEYNRADGSKFRCTYMHLQSVNVKSGDTVNAGQQVGIVGSTGRSTGSHLHFQTDYYNLSTQKWSHFDPAQYLAELSIRSDKQEQLNYQGQNLLANYTSKMAMGGQTVGNNTGFNLADVVNGNKWDKLMEMMQSDDNSEGMGISAIIGQLFHGALAIAVSLDMAAAGKPLDSDSIKEEVEKAQDKGITTDDTLCHRDREALDAESAKAEAQMTFDRESPEQQQSQGLRQA
ncbi:MAG: glucosaminidase domain-containing protein [Prevotellaceae bacterium]|nr:glucosaminidase domain-containing protein [Prevotellaceae bacterium]